MEEIGQDKITLDRPLWVNMEGEMVKR